LHSAPRKSFGSLIDEFGKPVLKVISHVNPYSMQSKELQPRDGEADRKANNGLCQVDDDGDADGSAHVSLQSGSMAIYKPRKE
jgi:hypothetical protein